MIRHSGVFGNPILGNYLCIRIPHPMNKFQLSIHHTFRYIWNGIFIISYPILATFGILFIGVTYVFSGLSSLLSKIGSKNTEEKEIKSDWEALPKAEDLLEAKIYKQIMFGPKGFQIRRKDGIPSVLENHIFGNKVNYLTEGILLEKWNVTDSKDLPDFDICIYYPDEDRLKSLTNIKCFDWHLSEVAADTLHFKWFDGTQGGEVKVSI